MFCNVLKSCTILPLSKQNFIAPSVFRERNDNTFCFAGYCLCGSAER